MSSEIRLPYTSGNTTTFVVRKPSDFTVWYPTTSVWEAYGTGGRTNADYGTALVDKIGDYYVGDFPTGIVTAGEYDIIFLIGGVFAGSQGIWWSGTAKIDGGLSNAQNTRLTLVANILEGDFSIDTTTTPWNVVIKIKGTSTELVRKELKDVTGANLTAITTVIGQQVEP